MGVEVKFSIYLKKNPAEKFYIYPVKTVSIDV